MDFATRLENIATAFNWRFVHSRRDYSNLTEALKFVEDEAEGYGIGETILFLDPVTKYGEKTDGITYTGNFMILTVSDLDDSYENKREKYIKPIEDILINQIKNNIRCNYSINTFKLIDVINVFDINADGVNVQFSVKG